MTKSQKKASPAKKQPKVKAKPAPERTDGELDDAELDAASGGALNAYFGNPINLSSVNQRTEPIAEIPGAQMPNPKDLLL